MRLTLGVVALMAALASGCRPTIYFETTVNGSTQVQGSPLGGLLGAFPGISQFDNLDLSQTQDFQNQGVTKNDVSSVKLKEFNLQITSPNNEDFSWLSSISFTASANGQSAVIASKSGVNQLGLTAPNPKFDLDLPDVELQPYVTASSMSITGNASGTMPPQDTTVQAAVRFGVWAYVVK